VGQCGKGAAIKTPWLVYVLPFVESNGFFFDSELIVRAAGKYPIEEISIEWKEDPASTVRPVRDMPGFIKEMARLKLQQWKGGV